MPLKQIPLLPPLTGDTSWIDDPNNPTMKGLPVPIAPARPPIYSGGSSGSTAPSQSSGPTVPSWLKPWIYPQIAPAGTPAAEAYSGSLSVEDYATIAVGLILLCCGFFAFKQTQTIIQGATKVGTKIAALTA